MACLGLVRETPTDGWGSISANNVVSSTRPEGARCGLRADFRLPCLPGQESLVHVMQLIGLVRRSDGRETGATHAYREVRNGGKEWSKEATIDATVLYCWLCRCPKKCNRHRIQ